jgi:hypothetical protein
MSEHRVHSRFIPTIPQPQLTRFSHEQPVGRQLSRMTRQASTETHLPRLAYATRPFILSFVSDRDRVDNGRSNARSTATAWLAEASHCSRAPALLHPALRLAAAFAQPAKRTRSSARVRTRPAAPSNPRSVSIVVGLRGFHDKRGENP